MRKEVERNKLNISSTKEEKHDTLIYMTETETLISKREAEKMYLKERDAGNSHERAREIVLRETGHNIAVPIKENEITQPQKVQVVEQTKA